MVSYLLIQTFFYTGPGEIVEETASEKFSTVRESSAAGGGSDGMQTPEVGGASTPLSDRHRDRSGTVGSEIDQGRGTQDSTGTGEGDGAADVALVCDGLKYFFFYMSWLI